MTYIKSPLNYVGGKYKLLKQIVPLFPKEIDTFVDLFCGGLNVGINANAKKVIANDICTEVIGIYNGIKKCGTEKSLELINSVIDEYGLSKTNREGYLQLRDDYNNGLREWYYFYSLILHSFNNQIRFNKRGEYNMPFGKDRSSFNPTLRKRFNIFSEELVRKNITFTSRNFIKKDNYDYLDVNDFVYIDPPYLIGCATYNESGGWCKNDEINLLKICDYLTARNIKFALSNVLCHKGQKNDLLIDWSKKYNIHYMDISYNNCNYQFKEKDKKTVEVLITNY